MGVESIVIWLIVGAIAGWLAGQVVKGSGYGLIGDIIVGIIGAVIAGWLLPRLGIYIGGGFIAAIIDAFIGAVILLIILRLVRR
ncbi:MAG: GlsB/YeaQ/YmgE family stress response membrane protein [Xanthobacteraceae bacterium]